MNIQEATKKALENNVSMYRKSDDHFWITPTDTPDCCIPCCKCGSQSRRWNPQAKDFLADDWEITERLMLWSPDSQSNL